MSLSDTQIKALNRNVPSSRVRTRESNGRELSYIEGWYAVAEANRIFGFDGWDRETLEVRCVLGRENKGTYLAVYIAKVRVTVRANGTAILREGHGSAEARGPSPGEVHDRALKAAETDATKRALATFGKPFGLALYSNGVNSHTLGLSAPSISPTLVQKPSPSTSPPQEAVRSIASEPQVLPPPTRIDKSLLAIATPRRLRDRAHLRYVAAQPCLLCGRAPSDAHHLRFAQSSALGRKVSDEFTVPLCRGHHRQVHQSLDEAAWWSDLGIDALAIARDLWLESHKLSSTT